ncbi:MAG: 3-deoxy-8-phosphooctulonate synthase, partial [Methylobacterium sp.]
MTPNTTVRAKRASFAADRPFALIAGPCQMESRDHAMMIAERMVRITGDLGIDYVFKASFDKANRTSLKGRRGIGLEGALPVFEEVADTFDVPVLTDVHTEEQCRAVG